MLPLCLGCDAAAPAPPPAATSHPLPTIGTPAGSATPAPSPATATGAAEARFIAAFRAAADKKDLEAMLRLYCWDGISAEWREVVAGNVRDELLQEVDTVQIVHAGDLRDSSVEGGVHWKANLKPVARLHVTYKPGLQGRMNLTQKDDSLGMKNGSYMIPVSIRQN
jgi:hypothetical protein